MIKNILFIIIIHFFNMANSQEMNINNVSVSYIYKNINNEVLELSEENGKGPLFKGGIRIHQ